MLAMGKMDFPLSLGKYFLMSQRTALEYPALEHPAQPASPRTSPLASPLAARMTAGSQRTAANQMRSAQIGAEQLATLQRLSQEIAQLETSAGRPGEQTARSSTGCAALDALLPRGGYAAGSVIEYLRSTPACGASTLVWAAAAAALEATDGFLVVVDTHHHIYPPSLVSHGIDLGKVIFVRPQSQADAMWAVDQALRTHSVAAVIAELERIDDRSARRLQLAAESGQGLALLLRGWQARQQPSWAEVQWLVRSEFNRREWQREEIDGREFDRRQSARQWHVQLSRVRGGRAGRSARLEVEPLSGRLRLAQTTPHTLQPSQSQPHERLATTASAQPSTSSGALHLAAQLAHTAHRPAAATPSVRRAAAS